jgi:NAD(P)-dependent dehydrogenase (short-subunit alcohol dehydrogenase family)
MAEKATTAIVTGGGSGIGEATAHRMAERGYVVAIFDIDGQSAREVVKSIVIRGGRAAAFEVDVSSDSSVEVAIAAVVAELGIPTILINCAGILHVAPALETTVESFDRVIAVNLRSVFLMCVTFAKRLVEAKMSGSIVNVSSIHAVISEPNASAYTAAKGGVEAMSRTFASEWAPHGIRVNWVRPGATRTALTDELYSPEILDALAQRIPMTRPAVATEIAAAIDFLASSDASYITGTALDVDGGYIMDGSLPHISYTSSNIDGRELS